MSQAKTSQAKTVHDMANYMTAANMSVVSSALERERLRYAGNSMALLTFIDTS